MKQLFTFLLLLFYLGTFAQKFETQITGKISGLDAKEILLAPYTIDFNDLVNLLHVVKIPVKENKFGYTLIDNHVQAYLLVFPEEIQKGIIHPKIFFNDSTKVDLDIVSTDSEGKKYNTVIKNQVGGKLNLIFGENTRKYNMDMSPINKRWDSMMKENKIFTTEYMNLNEELRGISIKDRKQRDALLDKMDSLEKNNKMYTPEALKISKKKDSILKINKKWKDDYLKNHTDLLAYFFLLDKFLWHNESPVERFKVFADKYPDHPYTKILNDKIKIMRTVKVGGKYIDVTAKTADGKPVKLSYYIKGKVAFINLWATWCGPCRYKGISMKKVYEKYKDKGFTAIGITGVYKNMDDYKVALKQDKYPWINLVEFNNENNIWYKYGIEGSGGSAYLVDAKGTILAVNPTAEEAEKILSGLFD